VLGIGSHSIWDRQIMNTGILAAAWALAFLVAADAPARAQTESSRPLGRTMGQPSTPLGQPGRTMGQPTTGIPDTGTGSQRPAIGAGRTSDPNPLPDALRDRPAAATPAQPPLLGSGGKAPDGSIPGGSLVALTEQERGKIRGIILSQSVAQEPRAEFKLMVGAKVPESVRLRPMPQAVLDIVPKYREFDFIIAADRIVIVQRSTREIDTMIPI
jgi:hypothetical protein